MSRYENYEIKNNVFGTLSAPISSLATTIQLWDWQGQRFSVNQLATLENIENWKVMKREIVLITAINWDVLTVTRKYAPCPANDDANTQWQVSYAFSTDDTISAYITKEHFDRVEAWFDNTNDEIDDILDNWDNKLRTYKTTWLWVEVKWWPVLVWSAYYDFDWWTLTLTDNATNYIEIDEDWNLVSNTTDWWDKHTKISKVITSGGVVTSIEDWRLWTVGGEIGGVNIHDLTEKTKIVENDELIVADSENIYNNKKIKYSSIMPWTLISFFTLWETVIAGDGTGAVYIGNDGKAYNSNVAWHNYCDWIALDSWNSGDTVRIAIGWFIPCSWLNNNTDIVSLAYTSWTTNTWYGDYIPFWWSTPWVAAFIDNVQYSGICMFSDYVNSTNMIFPLYWKQGTNFYLKVGSWTQAPTCNYVTWLPWQYWDNNSYAISWCEIWHKVPWWFIFEPKPKEILALTNLDPGGGREPVESSTVQATCNQQHTFTHIAQNSQSNVIHFGWFVKESADGQHRVYLYNEAFRNTAWNQLLQVGGCTFNTKKWFYYKVWIYKQSVWAWYFCYAVL